MRPPIKLKKYWHLATIIIVPGILWVVSTLHFFIMLGTIKNEKTLYFYDDIPLPMWVQIGLILLSAVIMIGLPKLIWKPSSKDEEKSP